MTSATVAGDGAGCCTEPSAMIRSLEDPIALLGIRSHRWARGGVRLVAFAARMRWDGAVGSCDDVSSRDMRGMTWMTQKADMLKVQVGTVADSESRTLLKTAGKSGRPVRPVLPPVRA